MQAQSEFCLVFGLIVFQATASRPRICGQCAQNLLILRSPHLSFTCGSTMTFVWAWICVDDTRASCLKAKGRRYYLSKNICPAVSGSAGPAVPPLM